MFLFCPTCVPGTGLGLWRACMKKAWGFKHARELSPLELLAEPQERYPLHSGRSSQTCTMAASLSSCELLTGLAHLSMGGRSRAFWESVLQPSGSSPQVRLGAVSTCHISAWLVKCQQPSFHFMVHLWNSGCSWDPHICADCLLLCQAHRFRTTVWHM